MKPIRVLHVIGTMNQGGAETLIMELFRHIDRSKIQFDFLIYNYTNQEGYFDSEIRKLGGKIYFAKQRLYKSPIGFLKELYQFFKNHPEYQIIHSHQYTTTGYILMAAKLCKKTTVAHAHAIKRKSSFSIKGLSGLLGCILLRRSSDYVMGCSEDALKSLAGRRADGKKCFLFKNAIDINRFLFSEKSRLSYRKKMNICDDEKVIGCVGRFCDVKNHAFLIKAFKEALNINRKMKLVLVGTGPLEMEMMNLAKDLDISQNIIFLGNRSDVNDILNAFDLFCLPSKSEGLGIVYIEAQCNGLPCIAPKDVVPQEADIGANLMVRVSLQSPIEVWGSTIIDTLKVNRRSKLEMERLVKNNGYDIGESVKWLQDFYLRIIQG